MCLASVLTPMSNENLRLAVQCGVTDIVDRYPGPTLEDVLKVKARVESFGLRLAAIEGYVPMENLIFGRDDDTELAAMRAYREVGFDGPIRPDHVPQFAGEEGEPGYTMQGRLFAYGYIRALLQATEN